MTRHFNLANSFIMCSLFTAKFALPQWFCSNAGAMRVVAITISMLWSTFNLFHVIVWPCGDCLHFFFYFFPFFQILVSKVTIKVQFVSTLSVCLCTGRLPGDCGSNSSLLPNRICKLASNWQSLLLSKLISINTSTFTQRISPLSCWSCHSSPRLHWSP